MSNQPCSPGCDKLNCNCALEFDEMRLVPHEEVVAVMMQDPDYRKAHRIGHPHFDIAQQFYERRKLVGADAGEILASSGLSARLVERADSGEDVRLGVLARIAEALGCHIKIELVPNDSLPKEEGGEK